MSYIKAEEILPRELIETIQQYVSGKNIYIPCKEKEDWGSKSGSREYYGKRNREIRFKHQNGIPVKALALEYSLSEKSIHRVLRASDNKKIGLGA